LPSTVRKRLDGNKARKTADNIVHPLAESIIFVTGCARPQLQVADYNYFANHVSAFGDRIRYAKLRAFRLFVSAMGFVTRMPMSGDFLTAHAGRS
jgi:hypothetical protein